MSTMQVALLLFVILAVVAGAVRVLSQRRRKHQALQRREALQRRFGPEYERVFVEHERASLAERELVAREERVLGLRIRELNDQERKAFSVAWENAQVRFVDDPSAAVHEADQLIKVVMSARGYPMDTFEQRVADLSVDHADVVQHYRAARALAAASRQERANTEELRQAFVHYRALFGELLAEPSLRPPTFPEEARV